MVDEVNGRLTESSGLSIISFDDLAGKEGDIVHQTCRVAADMAEGKLRCPNPNCDQFLFSCE